MANPHELSAMLKTFARHEGFELVGIARVEPSAYEAEYRAWITAGKHGEMEYLARGVEERMDLQKRFPWVRSVLCVGLSYYTNLESPAMGDDARGKIARYAWGRDYHKVMDGKLKRAEKKLREAFREPFEARIYCDTGPVLERELAARAGLGWVGKNTLLIHPRHGSWFVLGEMLLSLELEPDSPVGDHCGTCRRCIEACPTEAIEPYRVDARKCISYLTLEHRTGIPEPLKEPMQKAGFVIGCDICQDVCPFNRKPLATHEADFAIREPAPALNLSEILSWHEAEWDAITRGRAFRRAKLPQWKQNAEILEGHFRTDGDSSGGNQ